jgi:hypothetical protein
MRTKTILLSAAIGALSSAALMAQVYSVNTVGYMNVTIPGSNPNGSGGFAIIANQLNTGNNVITNLIPVDPNGGMDGDTLFKYNPITQTYSHLIVDSGNLQNNPPTPPWDGGDPTTTTLNPGEAAFFYNAYTTSLTITFVGTVLQNPSGNTNTAPFLTNSLVGSAANGSGGFSLVSSIVPQGGDLSTNLGLTVDPAGSMDGDTVYVYNASTQQYSHAIADSGNYQNNPPTAPWDPLSPSVAVGQGFFFYNAYTNTFNWTRNFVVN